MIKFINSQSLNNNILKDLAFGETFMLSRVKDGVFMKISSDNLEDEGLIFAVNLTTGIVDPFYDDVVVFPVDCKYEIISN